MTIVRRGVALVLALALVAGSMFFAATPTAQAQGQSNTNAPGVWQSSINMQNVSPSTASSLSIAFYQGNSSTPATTRNLTADELSQLTGNGGFFGLFVPAGVPDLAGGQYSAVITSDVQVEATVNTGSTNNDAAPWTIFAYEGFNTADTATSLFFPGNYKEYFGFNSEMVIQNAGSAAATVEVDFYAADGNKINSSPISLGTIQSNASQTFPMSSSIFASLPSGNSGLFGAVVTATNNQPIAGVVNIWRSSGPAGTAGYSGFTTGSTELFVPSLYQNYFNFGSALTVQNISSSETANVTVTYQNGATENFTLAPFAARELVQGNAGASLPSGNQSGLFGATVTTTGGSIVGLVSLSQFFTPVQDANAFASYSVPASTGTSLNIPVVLKNYFGFFTAVTVYNAGDTATTVTMTLPAGTEPYTQSIPARSSQNFIFLKDAGPIPDADPGTQTSATITSSNNAPLVAVIQQNTESSLTRFNAGKVSGDFLSAFTGSVAQ